MKLQKNNQKLGFTLIEMLLIMAITAIIATISIMNFRKVEKNRQVIIGADIIVQALNTAQNNILSGKTIQNSTCVEGKNAVSYDVTFQSISQNIVIRGNDKCGVANIVQTIKLPTGTRLKPVDGIQLNGANVATLSITYFAPFGNVRGVSGAIDTELTTPANITLQSITDTGLTKIISINGSTGRITY